MATKYQIKMRIKAEETRKETVAELQKMDAKYSKMAAEMSAEFDRMVIEGKRELTETLDMMVDEEKREVRDVKDSPQSCHTKANTIHNPVTHGR